MGHFVLCPTSNKLLNTLLGNPFLCGVTGAKVIWGRLRGVGVVGRGGVGEGIRNAPCAQVFLGGGGWGHIPLHISVAAGVYRHHWVADPTFSPRRLWLMHPITSCIIAQCDTRAGWFLPLPSQTGFIGHVLQTANSRESPTPHPHPTPTPPLPGPLPVFDVNFLPRRRVNYRVPFWRRWPSPAVSCGMVKPCLQTPMALFAKYIALDSVNKHQQHSFMETRSPCLNLNPDLSGSSTVSLTNHYAVYHSVFWMIPPLYRYPDYIYTVKPVFKTTWEIGTTWELRTAISVPRRLSSSCK